MPETATADIFSMIAPQHRVGLPVNDAATYLGIGRTLLYELLSEGVIKSVHIRGRRVILRESLDDYVRSLSVKGL